MLSKAAAKLDLALLKYLPHKLSDRLASFLTVILIPIYFCFETFHVLPAIYAGSISPAVYYAHVAAASVLLVNAGVSFVKIIVTQNTTGSIILPAVLPPNWRFCYACEGNAPPRSYHCRTCNKCILKRDHHCTFTGNCIGYYNHRYFLLFLLYMVIAGVYSAAMNVMYLRAYMNDYSLLGIVSLLFPFFSVILRLERQFAFATSLLISFGVFGTLLLVALFVYHMTNMLRGQLGHERVHRISRYDLGSRQNVVVAMGTNWYYAWLSPLIESPMIGDGITFEESAQHERKNT